MDAEPILYPNQTPSPFDILYQDPWILAVNKRTYIPVEPSVPGDKTVETRGMNGNIRPKLPKAGTGVGQSSPHETTRKLAASEQVGPINGEAPPFRGASPSPAEEAPESLLPQVSTTGPMILGRRSALGAPESLLQQVKRWLETQCVETPSNTVHKGHRHTPPRLYLGLVHRIDQPVTGVVLFARDPETLASLNRQFRDRQVYKLYWAITEARPAEEAGTLEHFIVFDPKKNKSRIVDSASAPALVHSLSGSSHRKSRAKKALLHYRVVGHSERYFFLEIELVTGRPHQIRAQLAAIGCPVKGDLKYGARRSNPGGGILLHARSIRFTHPGTGRPLTLTSDPPPSTLWDLFPRVS